jgi:hypothetical protein
MDIVKYFSDQVNKWNQDEKCEECFEFSAPMFESAINEVAPETPCCVQVMLTDLSYTEVPIYGSNGLLSKKACEYNFTLYVLKASSLGVNNYNEVKGHDIATSKWETIYKPLQNCFGCDAQLDFCTLLGYAPEVKKWSMRTVRNYQDLNFDGWRIDGIFKINN